MTWQVAMDHKGKTFALVQDALNASVPREILEDARNVPGIDMGARAVSTVMYSLTLTLEDEQARLATDPANYSAGRKKSLSAATQWSHADSDPVKAVEEAKEAVRMTAGLDPNRMVFSKPVFNALKNHPKITDRFKYTTAESITTAMLANLFDLDVVAVGKAVALADADETAPFVDVWGNSAVLAYVPNAPGGYEEPSFGYTYTLAGHPFVEEPYWDGDRKSWVYGVTYERLPVLTGISSGFQFQNVVKTGE